MVDEVKNIRSAGTTVKYYNWRAGEPNDWNGQVEDCVEVLNDGQWNDELCNQTVPFICKKVAATEWCQAATTSGNMKKCGEFGVNEEECRNVFGCCWDPSKAKLYRFYLDFFKLFFLNIFLNFLTLCCRY